MEAGAWPVGVLVIRVWVDGPDAGDLRARLRASIDIAGGTAEEQACAGREAVVAAVERWLDGYLGNIPR